MNKSTFVPKFRAAKWLLAALLFAAVGHLPGGARAGDRAVAQSLFEAAQALMDQEKYDEACPKYAASFKEFPSPGALLNLALCHEKQGKTASAWSEATQAVAFAEKHGRDEWATKARELVKKLEPTLSKLTIEVPKLTPGLKVMRNQVEVSSAAFGTAMAVDPGEVTIEARAPGYHTWTKTIKVAPDGASEKITIPELEKAPEPPPTATPTGTATGTGPPPEPSSPIGYYIGGAIAGAVGLTGIILGSVFGMKAKAKWDDAQEFCPEETRCYPDGVTLVDDAKSSATIGTVGFVVGGVGIAGAILLFVLAPSGEPEQEAGSLRFVPTVTPEAGFLTVQGVF